MSSTRNLTIRPAEDRDLDGIMAVFEEIYGHDYPYQGFFDPTWLKRSIYSDEIVMLVALDEASDTVLGTASVVLDIGAHSDLAGEFGRLAVRSAAQGRGVGSALMKARVRHVEQRLHVGIVGNRVAHPYSQRISQRHGFAAVGFLPLKHLFKSRESISAYARHFGPALALRRNHPRVVPEAHTLAHLALSHMGIDDDVVVNETAPPYPLEYPDESDLDVQDLTAEGLPSVLRIERGRVRRREVFGPGSLHHGLFQLRARSARYLIARRPSEEDQPDGVILGAIGWIHNEIERSVRVQELIVRSDDVVRFLFDRMVDRCRADGVEYIEVDVSAHAPRMQRTLIEAGFMPAAYIPAFVFHRVERLDTIRMVRLLVPPVFEEPVLIAESEPLADVVMEMFERQAVLPRIATAVDRISLFDDLNEEQISRVASVCGITDLRDGDVLFEQGDEADEMYLIIEGAADVRVGDGTRVPVGTVEAGEALGEVSLLAAEKHSASACASSDLVAATLGREALQRLTRARPDIAATLYRNLTRGLGRKLRAIDGRLVDSLAEDA